MADRSMTDAELYAAHIAEGVTPQAAAALVDTVVNWPGWSLKYDADEPEEWVRPRRRGDVQRLQMRVCWLERELEELKTELKEEES